jgi:hypothetical protein
MLWYARTHGDPVSMRVFHGHINADLVCMSCLGLFLVHVVSVCVNVSLLHRLVGTGACLRATCTRQHSVCLQVEDFSEFGKGKKLGARNRRVYPL